jgi:K+-transporting ATPase KdpF subunit
MNAELWIAGLTSLALAAYLVYAIINPEKF